LCHGSYVELIERSKNNSSSAVLVLVVVSCVTGRKMGFSNSKFATNIRLDGKTAIVTGANTGIGKVTAMELYKIGQLKMYIL
jgi:hypothetical protein